MKHGRHSEKVADDVAVKKMKRSLSEAIQQADKACQRMKVNLDLAFTLFWSAEREFTC